MRSSGARILLDLLAGLIAIVAIGVTNFASQVLGADLRALFAACAVGFFVAGAVRGRGGSANPWLQGLLVSSPGLLGDAALIVNNGLHQLLIAIAVTGVSIAAAIAGVMVRRASGGSRRRSTLAGAGALGSLLLLVALGVPRLSLLASVENTDAPAPRFTLAAFDGTTARSSDLRRRVVVLAFWATWCGPCRRELPELESAYAQFRGDPRVAFLAVEIARGGETPERGRSYLARRGLTLPGAFDSSGDAARAFGVDAIPTLVLIDANGHIRMRHYGYDPAEHFSKHLSQSIARLL